MTAQQPPPPDAVQYVDRDDEHLRILSILHYVFGALAAMGGCVPAIYVALGAVFLVAPQPASGKGPPAAVGWVLMLVGGGLMLLGLTIAALIAYSGRCLAHRRRHTFSFVVACLMLLSFPLGTALGVFTIIVLSRPTVKSLYQQSV
ncbi:MAG: hypothetical protein KIS92_26320 [Planctomycetota bacterium]|nr:hypothetical protein [Planctomycetota bacterium]